MRFRANFGGAMPEKGHFAIYFGRIQQINKEASNAKKIDLGNAA
jgi:hypothetical protein